MNAGQIPLEISVTHAKQLLDDPAAQAELIDVREPFEREICAIAPSRHIPMGQIPAQTADLPRDRHLLILCHHGGRSLRVTQFLREKGFSRVTSIAGGIDAWAEQIEPAMKRY